MLSKLSISGLRGFATTQTLTLSQPTGSEGSGLTVIVGANNAGKSTAIEALRALTQEQALSFTQGRRNHRAGDKILLRIDTPDGEFAEIESVRAGSSETKLTRSEKIDRLKRKILVLPSRRTFEPFFAKGMTTRDDYMINAGFPSSRSSAFSQFTLRLFAIEQNRESFDLVLGKVLNPVPEWSIDQMDSGQYFLKISSDGAPHSSEGMGDGLVSLFFIIDALYDSTPGHLIAIDEPELSLHPALQKKIFNLFLEYSKDRQIVIATHSPYMIPFAQLSNGASIVRSVTEPGCGTQLYALTAATGKKLLGLTRNLSNPHILGLDAREILFVEDGVVLVEGQDDIVYMERVSANLAKELSGTSFGWGAGGATNMDILSELMSDLGFKRVCGILDSDQIALAQSLQAKFPAYKYLTIPAKDIRTKAATAARVEVCGLLGSDGKTVRPEHVDAMKTLIDTANTYLSK